MTNCSHILRSIYLVNLELHLSLRLFSLSVSTVTPDPFSITLAAGSFSCGVDKGPTAEALGKISVAVDATAKTAELHLWALAS